jgi:hypothetical protein
MERVKKMKCFKISRKMERKKTTLNNNGRKEIKIKQKGEQRINIG